MAIVNLLAGQRLVALIAVLAGALLGPTPRLSAQSPGARERQAATELDSMLKTAGPAFRRFTSRHFELYVEPAGPTATRMLDSLEGALRHAYAFLGATAIDTATITVFVTASRTRFPLLLTPTNKGARVKRADLRDVIVLVVNDSVRSYARHEVMHVVGFRVWGGQRTHPEWMTEGLATYADGLCQGVPIVAVARDLLRGSPSLTVAEVTRQFRARTEFDRASTYVLAASLVDYLWQTRGRDGFKRLWQGTDSLTAPVEVRMGFESANATLTRAWRSHVERVAGSQRGVTATALQRSGCG